MSARSLKLEELIFNVLSYTYWSGDSMYQMPKEFLLCVQTFLTLIQNRVVNFGQWE